MRNERTEGCDPGYLVAYRDHLVSELLEVESRLAGYGGVKRIPSDLARVLGQFQKPMTAAASLGS